MQDPNDPLNIHDISIVDQPRFGTRGEVLNWRTVTYWLGQHGPFILSDNKQVLNSAEITKRIQAEQSDLRTLDGLTQ